MGNDENAPMSLGEIRVRSSFNPSNNGTVDSIKSLTAQLINLCEGLKHLDPRLAALAQTEYENAAMWAVKAATTEVSGTLPSVPLTNKA